MPTKYKDLFEALMEDFHPDEVKTRDSDGAKFAKARSYMNRLDKVVGPENWGDVYEEHRCGIQCYLQVKMPDGQVVEKSGIAAFSPLAPWMPSEPRNGDIYKSNDQIKLWYEATAAEAFKRAAVKFGVGRYLYNDGTPLLIQAEAPPSGQAPVYPSEIVKKAEEEAWKNPATGKPLGDSIPKPLEITPLLPADWKPPTVPPPLVVKAWDPKQLNTTPQAKTTAVFNWIMAIGQYYGFDATAAVNKIVREKNYEPDCRKWDAETVERFCKFLRTKAAKSQRYAADNPTPATELKAAAKEADKLAAAAPATPSGPGIRIPTPAELVRARKLVNDWAAHCAMKGLAPDEDMSDERLGQFIFNASGYKIHTLEQCTDIVVLEDTLASLKQKAAEA